MIIQDTGSATEIGEGRGTGFNINIPINSTSEAYKIAPQAKIRDVDYLYILQILILPILKSFCPEIILVSCGFDALKGDPIGKFMLSPKLYHDYLKEIEKVCPKLIVALEGGYNLKMVQRGSAMCLKALLGQEMIVFDEEQDAQEVNPCVSEAVLSVIDVQKQFWPILE